MTAAVEGGVSGQQQAPAVLYLWEKPGTHFTGGWVGPRVGLDGMLDTPCSEVVWRVLATHSIPPVSPSLLLPCVIVCRHISTGVYISRGVRAMCELLTAKPLRISGQVRSCSNSVEQNSTTTAVFYQFSILTRPSVTFLRTSVNSALKIFSGKGKGKVHPRTGHEAPQGK